MVREVNPVHISPDTEPDTDVIVITGKRNDYRERHPGPSDVVVLVGVADSSMDYDLGEKVRLYSECGINDYRVVLPEQKQIAVHRIPTAFGYTSIRTLTMEDTVSPLAAEDVTLSLRDLLGLTAQTEE